MQLVTTVTLGWNKQKCSIQLMPDRHALNYRLTPASKHVVAPVVGLLSTKPDSPGFEISQRFRVDTLKSKQPSKHGLIPS